MNETDSHFFTIFCASGTACDILDLLPECDLVEDLRTILNIQYDICRHIEDGKPYGNENLTTYLEYLEQITMQVNSLKLAMKEEV
jgi:hypothetical protein